MKKNIIPFFMLISILFISCKQAAFDKPDAPQGYGTVIIGIAENEVTRAVGENGLPVLKDSKMTIEVTKADRTLIKKRDFNEGDDKTLSLTLPVGEKITVKVTVHTTAAQWLGEAERTVTEGANKVDIKLKKSAAALKKLLFGTGKPHSSGPHDYTLTLKIGSKEIKKEHITGHNFCRDNKGRTYLAYQESSGWKLERYTSEGKKEENKNFTLPEHCHRLMLASDYATGKVYLVAKISWPMKLYRINEDGTNTELTGAAIGDPTGYAVYDDILISADQHQLKMYRINGDNLSEIQLSSPSDLRGDTKIMLGNSLPSYVRINDLYMTENTLYVLFSAFDNNSNNSGKYYSLGGVVKYSYTADGTISKPKPIGIKDSHTAQNGIYATDESTSFYGPVKVVGFDEEKLYIADDGVSFKKTDSDVIVEANQNRIAALNYADDSLVFKAAGNGVTWNTEEKVTKTADVTITIGNDNWKD